jgi:hypothetical protein
MGCVCGTSAETRQHMAISTNQLRKRPSTTQPVELSPTVLVRVPGLAPGFLPAARLTAQAPEGRSPSTAAQIDLC